MVPTNSTKGATQEELAALVRRYKVTYHWPVYFGAQMFVVVTINTFKMGS